MRKGEEKRGREKRRGQAPGRMTGQGRTGKEKGREAKSSGAPAGRRRSPSPGLQTDPHPPHGRSAQALPLCMQLSRSLF